MKYFKLSLLFCLLLNTAVFAQNNLSRTADSLYKAKNYTEAGKLYLLSAQKMDFKISKTGGYYNAACCYALNGRADSAMTLLKSAIAYGYKDLGNIKKDSDLMTLHSNPEWDKLISSIKVVSTSTHDPYKAKLVTSDIKNFWKAYDLAQTDTAKRSEIYRTYYIDAGTEGLQDYFGIKVKTMRNFLATHDQKPNFYRAIRKNTFSVDKLKPQMLESMVKLKQLYPQANFPNIYFVIGAFTSGGTSSDNGLLIGLDQGVRTPDIPVDELTLWQRNNFAELKNLPNLIAHELIHFNQEGMKNDTTLLHSVLVEGMADFIGELISGKTANSRLHLWAKGKEKLIWADFKKEMYLNRYYNWIANSNQETAEKPADLGYWVGYQICKAYYNNSTDKQKAISDMLNIKDYNSFYEKSGADKLF
ncbi:TPR end-of-group domain-containing protein [Pedobacter cryoconitis]|uniref:Uncharacterized protein YjaZ n=1 Tax=Pedobacter cryoconitis TaxID=188932 RepID=A0A7X0IZR0_9SPHI|nr:DUF2268 domain-containing putative Zn-dependent protease [Pedobacter cryoconitis]MBB6498373.1 uncharacterized protein YjaZ [Pedobacter cryoconitis]